MTMKTPRLSPRYTAATVAATLLIGACLRHQVSAQILPPLDVTASQPIYNSDGVTLLPGNNPFAGNFGYSVVAGCLVQILDAGTNATSDPIALNGNPTGDDTVLATTSIGAGIAPDVTLSGRFSVSIYPPPASGSRLYARIFNAASLATATRYAQSSLFTVSGVAVFDVSALGLSATTAQATCVVTGRVELEGFQGANRLVTFIASSGSGPLQTNAIALPFSSGAAAYSLAVPTNAAFLSAKTAWHLCRRVPGDFALGPVTMNFLLPGGDLDGSNFVDIGDYFLLAGSWYLPNPAADIDGSGLVDLDDYFLLAHRWHEAGDLP